MKRNISIQLLRIFSTFLIIVCHLTRVFPNKYIVMTGQLFNVGVYIFLIISGYLFAEKAIDKPVKWFFSRIIKLLIPVYLFLIYIFISNYYINGVFEMKYIFYYLFNIQGLFSGLNGAGHLWFLTSIMFCYLLLPIVKKIDNKNVFKALIAFSGISLLTTFVSDLVAQQMFYVTAFYLGYIMKKYDKKVNVNNYCLFIIIALLLIVRIIFKIYFDETILYNVIITSITHSILGCCISIIFIKLFSNLKENKLINYLDYLSFYIYITHYTFIVGPIKTISLTNILFVNIMITLLVTFVSSIILKFISELILRRYKA